MTLFSWKTIFTIIPLQLSCYFLCEPHLRRQQKGSSIFFSVAVAWRGAWFDKTLVKERSCLYSNFFIRLTGATVLLSLPTSETKEVVWIIESFKLPSSSFRFFCIPFLCINLFPLLGWLVHFKLVASRRLHCHFLRVEYRYWKEQICT